jgi:hypothetical protein
MKTEIRLRATIDADGRHCSRACQYNEPSVAGARCGLFLQPLLADSEDGRHLRCGGCLRAAGAERGRG